MVHRKRGTGLMKTKVCSGCKQELTLDRFYPNVKARFGVASRCKPCANISAQKWKDANKEKAREIDRRAKRKSHRKTKYGISPEMFADMLLKSGSACTICRRSFLTTSDAHIDHDHRTGKIRNLLCAPCNMALGLLKDDPLMLIRAAQYLISHGEM